MSFAGNAGRKTFRDRPDAARTSRREHTILDPVVQGAQQRIVAQLGISERTVRNNVSIIIDKLDVHSCAQVVVRARETGLGERK
jgi:DNA-binding NarL/FixJ family response regulator